MTERVLADLANRVASLEASLASVSSSRVRMPDPAPFLIATRLLRWPQPFSGSRADWNAWRFTLAACAARGPKSSRGPSTDVEVLNVQLTMPERWLRNSSTSSCEKEPDTGGRDASLLQSLVSFTRDTRGSLDALGLLIQKYEASTGTPISEPLQAALIHRGFKIT